MEDSLGHGEYKTVLTWLSREPGLSASKSFSGWTGGVIAEQGADGVQGFSGCTLALGSGFMEDR